MEVLHCAERSPDFQDISYISFQVFYLAGSPQYMNTSYNTSTKSIQNDPYNRSIYQSLERSPYASRGKLTLYTRLNYIEGHRHSISSKPTCDKPKAAKRPESASEASSTRPEVYLSRSEHMPEAPTCIHPRVNNSQSEQFPATKFLRNNKHPWIQGLLWVDKSK